MSNITPQKAKLNRGILRKLEGIEVKYFTKLFDKNMDRLSSSNRVKIPDTFYKIYIGVKKGKEPQSLAFIIPQNIKGYEPLTTIDDIEA